MGLLLSKNKTIDLLDEFKHMAIDRKTTVTALFIEAMKQYLKAAKQ
jgi:hypothetical protein